MYIIQTREFIWKVLMKMSVCICDTHEILGLVTNSETRRVNKC